MGDYSKYINQLNQLIAGDRIIRTAVSTALAMQKRRIFQGGRDSTGGLIGKYSTKKASIKGKTYPRGYDQYKAEKGKNPGYVNFDDTSQMKMDYQMIVIKPGQEYGLGFLNSFNYQKSQWLEEKFDKKVFFSSKSETQLVLDTINAQVNRLLKTR